MVATIDNQQFITDARNDVRNFWQAYLNLVGKQVQWNALDYGSTLMDGSGSNIGVTAAEVGAAIFASMNAITTVFNTGVATNLAELL